MHITLSPVRSDATLTLVRTGDSLTVNGEDFDFSGIPEGATLPQDAVSGEWLASDIERREGVLHLTVILPHGPAGSAATTFPGPITVTEDGPIALPFDPEEDAE